MKPSECGKSVTLYQRTKNGTDAMNRPVYITTPVTVDNVFIGRPTQEEIVNELTLSGKKWVHTLGIPKPQNRRVGAKNPLTIMPHSRACPAAGTYCACRTQHRAG